MDAEASFALAAGRFAFEVCDDSVSVDEDDALVVVLGSFPFPLGVVVDDNAPVFTLGERESPGFPVKDLLGTIFFSVEGEGEVVGRRDPFEVCFCDGRVISLTVSGSGGTGAFFDFEDIFVLIVDAADVRLGLVPAAGVVEVAVAVVLTLTVETEDEAELRRGRGVISSGRSDVELLNDASLR